MINALYCTFYVGNQIYGVSVDYVKEVLMQMSVTTVPLSPPAVSGLMNLRGQIVTALNLRKILHIEDSLEPEMNIVVNKDGIEVSLQVDRIGDVISVNLNEIENPPETLQGVVKEFIEGIYPLKDDLLLIINIDNLLEDDSCIVPSMSL